MNQTTDAEAMNHPYPSELPFLPTSVITEVLCFLEVKSLMQFRCVNKTFKDIISDPHFVQKHLSKSQRNPHLALLLPKIYEKRRFRDFNLVTLPISRLLENFPSVIEVDPCYGLIENEYIWRVVGSCNGLLCLFDRNNPLICFWNPATRVKSQYFSVSWTTSLPIRFTFGFDTLNKSYKVVAFLVECNKNSADKKADTKNVVKIFSTVDYSWRNISCFPVLPIYKADSKSNNDVYLNGTINWLALQDYFYSNYFNCWKDDSINVEQFVIVSLDLSSETYTQLKLPQGFDKVPRYQPSLVVLMDCLCFCHDVEETHFVIWQMKDFGVEESWIQLFQIRYNNCFKSVDILPLYLSNNSGKLILANDKDDKAFIYNCRDNTVEEIEITDNILWSHGKNYIQSLVSIDRQKNNITPLRTHGHNGKRNRQGEQLELKKHETN